MSLLSTLFSAFNPYFASSTALPFTKPEFYVWAFCIGFNVAMVFVFVLKSVESKFIVALFNNEALSEDKAITLQQAGVKGTGLLRYLLRDNGTLRSVVLLSKGSERSDEQGTTSKQNIDFNYAKFYINEEKLDRANSLKKGAMKWYLLPVFCAVSIGLAIGVCYVIPIFLNW